MNKYDNVKDRSGGTTEMWEVVEPAHEQFTLKESREVLSKVTSGGDTSGTDTGRAFGKKRSGAGRRGLPALRRSAIAAIAAVVVLGSFAVVGATQDVGPLAVLSKLMNPAGEREKDLLTGMGVPVGGEATQDGVKVRVTEAIGDRNVVYLVYEVESDKIAGDPDASYYFDSFGFFAKGSSGFTGWTDGTVKPDSDGKLRMTSCVNASDVDMSDVKATLKLADLRKANDPNAVPGEDDEVVASGTWEMSFDIDHADNSLKLADGSVSIGDDECSLSDVYLSPISFALSLKGDVIKEAMDGDGWNIFADIEKQTPLQLVMKDGSVYDIATGEAEGEGYAAELAALDAGARDGAMVTAARSAESREGGDAGVSFESVDAKGVTSSSGISADGVYEVSAEDAGEFGEMPGAGGDVVGVVMNSSVLSWQGESDGDSGVATGIATFPKIIDLDKVASVRIGEVEVPLG
jgi:hypothetical protein